MAHACLSLILKNINSNVSNLYARAESQECEHPHVRQKQTMQMATLHASLFNWSRRCVWQASEKRVLSLYWRSSFSETGLPAPYVPIT